MCRSHQQGEECFGWFQDRGALQRSEADQRQSESPANPAVRGRKRSRVSPFNRPQCIEFCLALQRFNAACRQKSAQPLAFSSSFLASNLMSCRLASIPSSLVAPWVSKRTRHLAIILSMTWISMEGSAFLGPMRKT